MSVRAQCTAGQMDARGPVLYGGVMRRAAIFWAVGLVVGCSGSGKDETSATEVVTETSAAEGTTKAELPTTSGSSSGSSSGGGESSSSGDDVDTGSSSEGSSSESGKVPGEFTPVYEQVIVARGCNSQFCHGAGIGGLELTDEATSYKNLVGAAATNPKCGQTLRISPGSLDESVVWYRVRPLEMDEGMPCASKMPEGSMGLTPELAQLVSDWISAGALE